MKKILFSLMLFTLAACAQQVKQPEITVDELSTHVSFLASDSLEGRLPGSNGSHLAAEYIRHYFVENGLQLIGDSGYQYFDVTVGVDAGTDNVCMFDSTSFELFTDYVPFSYSGNAKVASEVVFAGYGFDLSNDTLTWNDYATVDVKGKWVLLLRGDPELDNRASVFIPYSSERSKVLAAKDKGAAGVLFVSGVKMETEDKLMPLEKGRGESRTDLPVVQLSRALANKLLAGTGNTIEELEESLNTDYTSLSENLGVSLLVQTDVKYTTVRTQNVLAFIEGSDDALKNEWIVLGAHYDHLGHGGYASGSRMPDTNAVHNGADDNASGVAALLEIAAKLSANRDGLSRSVLCIAFGSEESGLLGSKYFVDNPLIDLDKVSAMLNFDMVGRLDTARGIVISGTGTSTESDTLLADLRALGTLKINTQTEGYGPSDHASFYTKDISVFFFSTGTHDQYHTPFDDTELINFGGQKQVADMGYHLATEIGNMPAMLTFQEAGPKERPRYGRGLRVRLGVMPGYGDADGSKGMPVDGVTPDGPAYKGGVLKGDKIVGINGMGVQDVYEYMARMSKVKPGDLITVEVMRGDEKLVLLVQL